MVIKPQRVGPPPQLFAKLIFMKHLLYFFLFIITISACSSSCNKDTDKYEEVYFEFSIPLTILPGNDTITLGQTLSFEANFPDSLFDLLSKKNYYLPNFNFKTVGIFRKLTNPDAVFLDQTKAVNKFQFTNTSGGFSNFSSTYADLDFVYKNNRYCLETKVKPLEKGVYSIHLYHSTGTKGSTNLPQELAPSVPGIKRFPIMQYIVYQFNSGDVHFNIFENNCKNTVTGTTEMAKYAPTTYTFVVK